MLATGTLSKPVSPSPLARSSHWRSGQRGALASRQLRNRQNGALRGGSSSVYAW